jgi:release factor glutamine methyltransferase
VIAPATTMIAPATTMIAITRDMGTATAQTAEALQAATDAIAAAGSETPRLDAEVLLAEASGWRRERLAAEPEAALPAGASRRFAEMVRRRVRREPVAYILGRKGFRRIELEVDRRVLIPRPETELLVEVALELQPASVLDVGTGSGAVALAIADELPEARVTATDSSTAALAVARENADRLGLAERVSIEPGTIPAGERYDLIVANLPYVSEAEWEGLAPEIREFEPREALVAGPSGLEAISALIERLDPGVCRTTTSALAFEVGAGQAGAVEDMMKRVGFAASEPRLDLAGIERVVVGRATGPPGIRT